MNSIKNLEIYHRNFVIKPNSESIDSKLEEQKQKLINYVKVEIDEEFHNRFIRNIEYDPEITLSRRLTELFKQLDSSLKEKFLKVEGKSLSSSIDKTVFSLVQTRHYLTHGDDISNYKKVITSTIDQFFMTSKLNKILKYYIYKELGILDDNIVKKLAQ